ncbi:MAG: hypothetical protein EOM03_16165 [Clostridia bacterium]|nr:hypothetical protein [Clostridia bacterium]
MRGYTIEEVRSFGVYCSRKRLKELYAGRETLTALELLALPIPDADKLCALLRPEMLPERELHILACDFAERVVHLASPEAFAAIQTKRLWADGRMPEDELVAARGKCVTWQDASNRLRRPARTPGPQCKAWLGLPRGTPMVQHGTRADFRQGPPHGNLCRQHGPRYWRQMPDRKTPKQPHSCV